MKFINTDLLEETNQDNSNELEVNRKNREDYEKLMQESSTNLDGYWDRKNPFVKFLLIGLALIIVVGVIYYVFSYMNQ